MNLVKRNYSNTDQIFRDFLGGTQYVQKNVPAVNITETENAFNVHLVAPGFEKSDFNIEVDNKLLVISSEIKTEKTEDGTESKFTKREFVQSSFRRSFKLPETVNEDDINASYHAGILNITLPKKQEALPKAKRMVEIS